MCVCLCVCVFSLFSVGFAKEETPPHTFSSRVACLDACMHSYKHTATWRILDNVDRRTRTLERSSNWKGPIHNTAPFHSPFSPTGHQHCHSQQLIHTFQRIHNTHTHREWIASRQKSKPWIDQHDVNLCCLPTATTRMDIPARRVLGWCPPFEGALLEHSRRRRR